MGLAANSSPLTSSGDSLFGLLRELRREATGTGGSLFVRFRGGGALSFSSIFRLLCLDTAGAGVAREAREAGRESRLVMTESDSTARRARLTVLLASIGIELGILALGSGVASSNGAAVAGEYADGAC